MLVPIYVAIVWLQTVCGIFAPTNEQITDAQVQLSTSQTATVVQPPPTDPGIPTGGWDWSENN